MNLQAIVDEMKVKDYGVFRRRVMTECGVSRTTFYQWRNGRGVCFYIRVCQKKSSCTLFAKCLVLQKQNQQPLTLTIETQKQLKISCFFL